MTTQNDSNKVTKGQFPETTYTVQLRTFGYDPMEAPASQSDC